MSDISRLESMRFLFCNADILNEVFLTMWLVAVIPPADNQFLCVKDFMLSCLLCSKICASVLLRESMLIVLSLSRAWSWNRLIIEVLHAILHEHKS